MADLNKIRYGIKNVYYAKATISSTGTATYASPVALPGAVSISMDAQGDTNKFYADNIVYFTSVANNGYEGDLELATIPESFKTDILGYAKSDKLVLLEDANAPANHFALMFQFEGDQKATRHVMYNCTAKRPDAAGNTKNESIEPETETLNITATSIYISGLGTGMDIVKAESITSTGSTTYNGWFSGVYMPTALTT